MFTKSFAVISLALASTSAFATSTSEALLSYNYSAGFMPFRPANTQFLSLKNCTIYNDRVVIREIRGSSTVRTARIHGTAQIRSLDQLTQLVRIALHTPARKSDGPQDGPETSYRIVQALGALPTNVEIKHFGTILVDNPSNAAKLIVGFIDSNCQN